MARGLWKGAISFGLVNVPVELHSAKKRSAELDMTMLDKRDLAPVGYKRVNKSTGKEVAWGDVVKGYEYKDDKYVVLSDEDFRRANPEAAKTVLVLNTLRYADELKSPADLEIPKATVTPSKAGETEELTAPGKEPRKEKSADVIDLMSLLKKSVEKKPAAKAKRPARKRRAA
jgi:DNA end-binding protein Ku